MLSFAPESQSARDAVRRAHGVRVVTTDEEGCAADQLPGGVFGFTGSPALASPLFATARYRNFEVHRPRGGDTVLIAFVTPAEADRLASGEQPVHITAYPDQEGDATVLVAIPYSRIVHHRQYSVRSAGSIALDVLPIGQQTAA